MKNIKIFLFTLLSIIVISCKNNSTEKNKKGSVVEKRFIATGQYNVMDYTMTKKFIKESLNRDNIFLKMSFVNDKEVKVKSLLNNKILRFKDTIYEYELLENQLFLKSIHQSLKFRVNYDNSTNSFDLFIASPYMKRLGMKKTN